MTSARKFGFELEYASGANEMVNELHRIGMMHMDYLHDYHCRCQDCSFTAVRVYDPNAGRDVTRHPADLRAQRDSTADGEFISRILDNWDDLTTIADALTQAASNAEARSSARCGLHVHVDTSSDMQNNDSRTQSRRIVPAAYLAFERYFVEIVAPGASIRKRDMNSTLMEAARQYVSDAYVNSMNWMDMGRGAVDDQLMQVISRDRHVDLNWSRTHETWEFRVFNATNAAWRIELACRMAVAFVEAAPVLRSEVESTVRGSKYWPTGCDSPWGEVIRPAYSALNPGYPTKRPMVPISRFIDILCDVDPDLRLLIERQANFMRTRFARTVECAS